MTIHHSTLETEKQQMDKIREEEKNKTEYKQVKNVL